MSAPVPQPGILDIAAYVGGASAIAGAKRIIKLSSNEGAFGPSPKAIEAAQQSASHMHRYPDGGATQLRQALADRHGLDVDRIVCGAGSDELLSLLCSAYAGPGDEVLHSAHGFLMYAISAKAAGATPVAAPEKNLCVDVDALLDHVTDKTRIVFVANPNNPTGTCIPSAEIERLWQGLPSDVLLVVDAAYAEFVDDPDYSAGQDLVEKADNVVMTRTFSKLYSLGGARIGWAYCSAQIADVLNRVRGPFNVTSTALAMGLAALGDEEFTAMVRRETIRIRDHVTDDLHKLQIKTTNSVGNFILMNPGTGAGRDAEACDEFLKARGIIVRRVTGYGLPDYLRVTVGTEEEMSAFLDAIRDFMNGAGL
ncbi:MAG: histidinol-phosphate transaminase [Rhodospirillales bacterium]|jgi:histidinol-phosphate aminotransferase|nr:histidinol-phosphate transaminase [Rhodospirillales bacterium]MBT4041032.1 histidinol-phosphate transaminase [Rhodospirillales bacterium]MBT4625279.1 histidinol-phosphate transaminase [Rhodospirillales bacterium]MBT5352552.1 histidinol-phosphate transaminase [Rhodospirillales bacterium]MBT5520809.1 histidinol-phosphate transaminase [Rhodospirillales bacterium]